MDSVRMFIESVSDDINKLIDKIDKKPDVVFGTDSGNGVIIDGDTTPTPCVSMSGNRVVVIKKGKKCIRVGNGGGGTDKTNLSQFVDDLGNSPVHSHSQYQESAGLSSVATTGQYTDLVSAPTNVSYFVNDANYATSSELDAKLDKNQGSANYGKVLSVGSDGNVVLSNAGQSGGVTEKSGGVTLSVCEAYNANGWGWREEKHDDGRLTVYVWEWFSLTATTSYKTMAWPTDATPFVDSPSPFLTAYNSAFYVYNDAIMSHIISRNSTKITIGVRRTNSANRVIFSLRFDGHWK